jgi:hypothetical protein
VAGQIAVETASRRWGTTKTGSLPF